MNSILLKLSTTARQQAGNFNWPEVEKLASDIIALDPKSAEGHFLSGLALTARQKPALATVSFEKSIALDSTRYDSAIELAGQYAVARRNGEAYALLIKYEDQLNNSPRYLDHAGTTYTNIGLPEKAKPLYERAVQLQPEIDLFRANLAACYSYLGHIREAEDLYLTLLRKNPAHQRNHYLFSRLKTAHNADHLHQMLHQINKTNLSDSNNIFIHNAIGKTYEDLEDWDNAFFYYKKAGDAATIASNYNITEDREIIQSTIDTYTQDWFKNTKTANNFTDRIPIFIVSLPRTGSTLTERIIGSHSEVKSLGETQFLPKNIRQFSYTTDPNQLSPAILGEASKADMQAIANGYLSDIEYRLGSEKYFIEKLPYNFLHIGIITKAFPQAKILYVERDPIDVCFAMYKQIFTWAYKFSYDLKNLGLYYNLHIQLLKHWKKLLGEKLVTIKYEELVADPDNQIRTLLNKLDLDFEDSCLNFHKNKDASTTASATQIRSKIHKKSVEKWRHFEQYLHPLLETIDR